MALASLILSWNISSDFLSDNILTRPWIFICCMVSFHHNVPATQGLSFKSFPLELSLLVENIIPESSSSLRTITLLDGLPAACTVDRTNPLGSVTYRLSAASNHCLSRATGLLGAESKPDFTKIGSPMRVLIIILIQCVLR